MQLAVQNFVSLLIVIYLQWYMPFESHFMNNIETFNELTALVLTYFLFCFTDFVPEPETRNDLGAYYNYVSFANIGVHISTMLYDSFQKIKLSCKRRYYARKAKKALEEEESKSQLVNVVTKKSPKPSQPLDVIDEAKQE